MIPHLKYPVPILQSKNGGAQTDIIKISVSLFIIDVGLSTKFMFCITKYMMIHIRSTKSIYQSS